MGGRTCVALGDSITAGYGARRAFPAFLADLLAGKDGIPWRMVVTGIPGEIADEGLRRIDRSVLAHRPDLVTVNYGVNDAFSGIRPPEFARTLAAICRRLREAGIPLTALLSSEVIPDPDGERILLPFWEAMARVAREEGAVYADVHGAWRATLERGTPQEALLNAGDFHPNEAGHRLIASTVFEALGRGEAAAG